MITVLCLQMLTKACFLGWTSLRSTMPLGARLRLTKAEWPFPIWSTHARCPALRCTLANEVRYTPTSIRWET